MSRDLLFSSKPKTPTPYSSSRYTSASIRAESSAAKSSGQALFPFGKGFKGKRSRPEELSSAFFSLFSLSAGSAFEDHGARTWRRRLPSWPDNHPVVGNLLRITRGEFRDAGGVPPVILDVALDLLRHFFLLGTNRSTCPARIHADTMEGVDGGSPEGIP